MRFKILMIVLILLTSSCNLESLLVLKNLPTASAAKPVVVPSVTPSVEPSRLARVDSLQVISPAGNPVEKPQETAGPSPQTAAELPPPPEEFPLLTSPIALPPRSVAADQGVVRVVMTDAPGDFSKIFFEVADLQLTGEAPQPLALRPNILPLELLSLREHPVVLAEIELKPARYGGVSFRIPKVRGLDRNGRPRDLFLVPEAVEGIRLSAAIPVKASVMTLIVLDFDARKSLISRDGRDILKPVITLSLSEAPISSGELSASPSNSSSPQPIPTLLPEPTRSPLLDRLQESATPTPSPTLTPRFDRLRG